MAICKNCGVELEDDMLECPLCGQPSNGDGKQLPPEAYRDVPGLNKKGITAPPAKFTWEIVSLILLCAIVVTLLVNFIINRKISWAEYPVAISLVVFCYVSVFAFFDKKTIVQIGLGFLLSAGCILVLDALTGQLAWAIELGIPLLLAANLLTAAMLAIINNSAEKGINLLAWAFLCGGMLCICVEAIVSYYQTKEFHFTWSAIVGICVLPLVLVLLFMHFRLKKGRSLKKTFHV